MQRSLVPSPLVSWTRTEPATFFGTPESPPLNCRMSRSDPNRLTEQVYDPCVELH